MGQTQLFQLKKYAELSQEVTKTAEHGDFKIKACEKRWLLFHRTSMRGNQKLKLECWHTGKILHFICDV